MSTVALRSAPLALSACDSLKRPQLQECPQRHFSANTSESSKRFLSSHNVSLDGTALSTSPPIPDYLRNEYWWAYGNPYCIRALDHQILVNIVLWGNFQMLRDVALKELCDEESLLHGRTLQVACVYANFTESLVGHMTPASKLDVIDVIPAQLENLKRKLRPAKNVTLSCYDAQDLGFDNGTFDQVILFFLLHETPTPVRLKTLKEVERVVKPGGKIVFVDYHRPDTFWWQSIMAGMYNLYEPFAMDLWKHEIQEWLPYELKHCHISKEVYFGGLYQKVVVTKE